MEQNSRSSYGASELRSVYVRHLVVGMICGFAVLAGIVGLVSILRWNPLQASIQLPCYKEPVKTDYQPVIQEWGILIYREWVQLHVLPDPDTGGSFDPSAGTKDLAPPADEEVFVDVEATYDQAELQRHILYPRAAREQGIEGIVIIRALINKLGKVANVIIDQSDNKLLEKAAVEAVRKTPFRPAIQNKFPVITWKQVEVKFRIQMFRPAQVNPLHSAR